MEYANIDMMGNEYRYPTEHAALAMSVRLPWAWKCFDLAVAKS